MSVYETKRAKFGNEKVRLLDDQGHGTSNKAEDEHASANIRVDERDSGCVTTRPDGGSGSPVGWDGRRNKGAGGSREAGVLSGVNSRGGARGGGHNGSIAAVCMNS